MQSGSILVTGASSGIGHAAARMLKARGWRVLATARRAEDLARLRDVEGVEALPLELSDEASIAACASAALEATGGRLDALFNNAAFGQVGAVEDLSAAMLRRQIEVNLIGTHELTRQLMPAMRAAGARAHRAVLVRTRPRLCALSRRLLRLQVRARGPE